MALTLWVHRTGDSLTRLDACQRRHMMKEATPGTTQTRSVPLQQTGTAAAAASQGDESNMPGFSQTPSDQDSFDVLDCIKGIWPPEIIEMHNGMTASTNQNAKKSRGSGPGF